MSSTPAIIDKSTKKTAPITHDKRITKKSGKTKLKSDPVKAVSAEHGMVIKLKMITGFKILSLTLTFLLSIKIFNTEVIIELIPIPTAKALIPKISGKNQILKNSAIAPKK